MLNSGAEHSEIFKAIIDFHPNPCVIHINFKPLYVNKAFATFSGFKTAEEVLSLESLNVLFVKDHWTEAERRYQEVINGLKFSKPLMIEHFDIHGNPQVAEITDTLVNWKGSKAMCTYISVVTNQVKREKLLHKMAMHDELTGAKNRRFLLEQFNNHNRTYLEGSHFLALIDLDHFKQVNDTWGHTVGDDLLKSVAQNLSSLFDGPNQLARIGGEEFALIIDAESEQNLRSKMTRIQTVVKAAHVVDNTQKIANSDKISCSASIGVTGYQNGDSFETIFKRADRALYRAKSLGRDRVSYCCEIPIGEY